MIPHQLPLMADLHFGDDRLPPNFWAKVRVDETTGCWLWTAALNSKGYGSWSFNGVVSSTHRVTYRVLRGPIPKGRAIDHLCEVKVCCNPAHLEAVKPGENNRRWYASQTHCMYGHPLSGDNLRIRRNGRRICRECRREHARQYRRRKAAARREQVAA